MEDYTKRFKKFLGDSLDDLSKNFNAKGYTYFCNNGLEDLKKLASEDEYNLREGDKFIIKLLYSIFDTKVFPLVKKHRFVMLDDKLKAEILEEMIRSTKIIHTPNQ